MGRFLAYWSGPKRTTVGRMSAPVSLSIRLLPRRLWQESVHVVALVDFTLIFVLSLALRLYGLGTKPFWVDEAVTKVRASLPFGKLVKDSFSHHHLPTYFLLLAQLSPGADPWLLRLPSAIAGALAAALGVLVGRKLAECIGACRAGGLMSGLMLAAAPVMVQYSQDARPYALELACLMLSLLGLVTLACNAEVAGGSWRQGIGAWSMLVLGMVGALALIGNAIPFLLVANVSAWPIARGLAGPVRRRFLLRWIAGQAAVLLAVAPLYLAMSNDVDGDYMAAFNWIPPLTALRAWQVAASVYLLRTANIASLQLLPVGLPALGLALPFLAGAGFVALRGRHATRIVMALSVLALPMVLVLSAPARPLWLPRYLLWSGAAFLILAAIGAARLVQRWRPAASAAMAALLLLNLRPFYGAETAPRWDLAAAALAPELAAGAEVYLDDHGVPTMLRAYLPDGGASLPRSKVHYQISEAEARLRAGSQIIAVHGPTGQELISPMSVFRAQVEQLGEPVEQIRIGEEIVLIRFDPPQASASRPGNSDVRPNP
jgi:mannosyltransferase